MQKQRVLAKQDEDYFWHTIKVGVLWWYQRAQTNTKTGSVCVRINIEVSSRNHCCRGKAVSISHSECVCVALVIQYTVRMLRILSCVVCPAVSCFYTLSHKRHDFRENIIEYEVRVLIFCTNFVWNISHSKQNSVWCYHKFTKVFIKMLVILIRL